MGKILERVDGNQDGSCVCVDVVQLVTVPQVVENPRLVEVVESGHVLRVGGPTSFIPFINAPKSPIPSPFPSQEEIGRGPAGSSKSRFGCTPPLDARHFAMGTFLT